MEKMSCMLDSVIEKELTTSCGSQREPGLSKELETALERTRREIAGAFSRPKKISVRRKEHHEATASM